MRVGGWRKRVGIYFIFLVKRSLSEAIAVELTPGWWKELHKDLEKQYSQQREQQMQDSWERDGLDLSEE